jgi:hypothetical protein
MRQATRADIGAMVGLLKEHHAEQAFPFSFDPAAASADLTHAIGDRHWLCLVADRSMFLGHCYRPPLVSVMVASEIMLKCSRPGTRRLFVDAFELWARERGCLLVTLATTHSIPAFGRLYGRDGYRLAEAQFIKVL